MLGLTWQSVKTYLDTKYGADIKSAKVRVTEFDLKGIVMDANDTVIPVGIALDKGQVDGLRLLVRKFHERERPDHIDAVILEIDWRTSVADSSILYRRDGAKMKYDERHNFA